MELIIKFLIALLLEALKILVGGFIIMSLWNWIVVRLIAVKTISYLSAVGAYFAYHLIKAIL